MKILVETLEFQDDLKQGRHFTMYNDQKRTKPYVKNASQVFITGQYLQNLYNLNYRKRSSEIGFVSSPTDLGEPELTNFLRFYFDISYYLCICPFRFVKGKVSFDEKRRRSTFRVHVWRPQKLMCALMHLLCLLRIVTEARLNTPSSKELYVQNPAQYFLLIMNLFNFLYKTVYMKRLWGNHTEFLHVLNYISSERNLPSSCAKRLRRTPVVCGVLLLYAGMGFFSFFAGKYFLGVGLTEWSPVWWYRRLLMSARHAFFYGENYPGNEAPPLEEFTLLDQCLGVVNSFGLISRYFLGFYTDLLVLSAVLTLWSTAYSFAMEFEEPDENDQSSDSDGQHILTKVKSVPDAINRNTWETIYKQFTAIRVLAQLMNNALGSIVCWFLGDAIMSYSVHMDAVLVTLDIFKRSNLLFYYFCTFGILFVAADICKQMEAIKIWIVNDRNRRTVPQDQVNIVLHEMLAKDVGIRGGNIFTITYSIAATFIGTIVTYFIICVQQNTNA